MAETTKQWIVGLDIGGTNVVVGLVPLEGGDPLGLRRLPTLPELGGEEVLKRVVGAATESMEEVLRTVGGVREDVVGVGIGAPGPLNRATGVLIEAPNLGWRNLPIRDLVAQGLGSPSHAGQRRQLRHIRRVVVRCRTGSKNPGRD